MHQADVKDYIDDNIKYNASGAITGNLLNDVLNDIVDAGTAVINVNNLNNKTDAYSDAATARAAVPAGDSDTDTMRKLGAVIVYLLSSGWIVDQFVGSDVSGWTTASNWKTIGPVSVSQNTETDNTDLNIGNTVYPFASVKEQLVRSGIITMDYLVFDLPAVAFNTLWVNIRTCANPTRPIYFFGFNGDNYDELGHFTPSTDGYVQTILFPQQDKTYERLRIVEANGDVTTNSQCSVILYRSDKKELNEIIEGSDSEVVFSSIRLDKEYNANDRITVKLLEYGGSAPVYLFGMKQGGSDTIAENMQVNQEVSFLYDPSWTFLRFYKNDSNSIKFQVIVKGINDALVTLSEDIQDINNEINEIIEGSANNSMDISVEENELISITYLSNSNANNKIWLFGIISESPLSFDELVEGAELNVEYSLQVPKKYTLIRLYCNGSAFTYRIKKTQLKKVESEYQLSPYPNIIPTLSCKGNQSDRSKDYYFASPLKDKCVRFRIEDNLPNSHTFYLFGMVSESPLVYDELVLCNANEEKVAILTKEYAYLRIYQTQNESSYDFDFTLSFFNENIVGEEEAGVDAVDRLNVLPSNPLAEIKREPGFGSIIHNWGIIGDSLSSGCTECRIIGTSGKIFLDLFDYSWGQCLFRLLGVEGYNFSYSGQQAKPWCLGWTSIQTTSVPPDTTPNPEDRIWDGTTVGVSGEHGAKYNPKQGYIIALGVNDSSRQEYPLGSISDINLNDYTQNGDSFYGYYAGIIQRIRSIAPRCFVFCVTRPNSDDSAYDNAIRDIVTLFDRCYCIDLANGVVYGSAFQQRYYLGGHMNAAGYEYTAYVMNTYIDWLIRNNFNDFKDAALVGTQYEIVP